MMSSPKQNDGNPYVSLMKTSWHYAVGERKRYLLIYGMFVGSNIFYSLQPIIYGMFINELQLEGMNIMNSAWKYVGLFLILHFVDWAFHGPARVMERELAFKVSKNFLDELYHKTLALPVKWHQDNHSGATINRVRKAYEALKDFFQNGFEYLHIIAKFLMSLGAMLYFAPLFGFITVFVGVFIAWIIMKFDKPYIFYLKEVNEKEHIVSSTLFDSLSNIITVITLRLEKQMEAGLLKKVMDVLPPFKKYIRINEWKWFVVDSLVVLIYVMILLGYIYQNYVPGEVFMIGTLVMVMGYVDRFTDVFRNIAWKYTEILKYHTDVTTVQSIIVAYDALHQDDENVTLASDWKRLQISQLNFSHDGNAPKEKAPTALSNISIQISKGKKIALIGESGSGKSTLLALLRGLYEPEDGIKIEVDGEAFDKLDIIRSKVTLFPQEPEIFENTIAYNITLGLPFSEAEIKEVCQAVQFAEVLEQLPKGLESSIKERGVNLSGGQKQRLALARGFFAAQFSDIILLDEPTSSVDPMTEMKIYDQLFKKFADKAVISALHRLHLLVKFDYIYVLQNGQVIDEGSLEYLKNNSPTFQELWRHQEKI